MGPVPFQHGEFRQVVLTAFFVPETFAELKNPLAAGFR
jgi:hypothetical protein